MDLKENKDKCTGWSRGGAGFTLIELMVTIAIIGILASLATTNYLSAQPDNRAKAAARQIWGDVYLARGEAIKRSNDVVMVFTPAAKPEDNKYTIFIDTNNNYCVNRAGACAKAQEADDIVIVNNKTLPTGVMFAGSDLAEGVPDVSGSGDTGDGISFLDNFVIFQPSGRAWNQNEETMSAVPPESEQTVYVIHTKDYITFTGENEAKKPWLNTVYAIQVDPISGDPEVRKWKPGASAWPVKPENVEKRDDFVNEMDGI